MTAARIARILALLADSALASGCSTEEGESVAEVEGESSPDSGGGHTAPLDSGTPADVEAYPACPETSVDECVRGFGFAECPGEGELRLSCGYSVETDDVCIWVEGCRPLEFPGPCRSADAWVCPVEWWTVGYGTQPISRTSDMVLALDVVPVDAGASFLHCTQCVPSAQVPYASWTSEHCLGPGDFCTTGVERAAQKYMSHVSRTSSGATFLAWTVADTDGYFSNSDYTFDFEADFERGTALVCIVRRSDTDIDDQEPICATEGFVHVSHEPRDSADAELMTGSFEAVFTDFGLYVGGPEFIERLVVQGAF